MLDYLYANAEAILAGKLPMPRGFYYEPPTGDLLHLDWETKGDFDITKVGLDRYTSPGSHPSVLMGAYSINDGRTQHWEARHGRMPAELKEALLDPEVEKWAFNAQFERVVTRRLLGLPTPLKNWRCSMALAYMHSFTGGLADVGAQCGLPDSLQKDANGKKLVKLFTMPQRITKNQPHQWRNWITDPELWEDFCRYNVQDNDSERALRTRLIKFPVPQIEWDFYELDQEINDRGIPIDMQFVENLIWMAAKRKAELVAEMKEITGVANPNSGAQLLPWLQRHGYPYADLQKESVEKAIKRSSELFGVSKDIEDEEAPDALRVLRRRQWASKTSTTKAATAKLVVGDDNRARYLFQFAGASRTDRFSARLIQPHNMERTPKIFDAEESDDKLSFVTDLIRMGDYYAFDDLFIDEPMRAFSGCMRGMLRAEDGNEFVTADLRSIESCVLGWMTECERLLEVFRTGRDPYLDFGTEFYRKPYEEITRAERQICKPPALGCLGADTQVLTLRGWRKIVDIHESDLVFDGVGFVAHSGVVDQGVKETIDVSGLRITPDHEILCGEDWCNAEAVSRNIRLGRKAIDLAIGGLLSLSGKSGERCTTGVNATVVGKSKTFMLKIWRGAKQRAAFPARTSGYGRRKTESMFGLAHRGRLSTGWQIGIMPSSPVVAGLERVPIDTRVGEFRVNSRMFTNLSDTSWVWKELTRIYTSIASTMTEIMKKEIFGSLALGRAGEIKKTSVGLNIAASECVQPSFGNDLRRSIEINLRSPVKFGKGCLPRKLFRIKRTAKVRTYDIANCGPRNRFMVLTQAGPMIVHNCGYRLSAGTDIEGVKTGLLAYAENMGVEMIWQEADHAVKTFRGIYPEVEAHWYEYERAVKFVLKTHKPYKVGPVTFKWMKPYLLIELPSRRCMYYYKPRLEKRVVVTKKMERVRLDDGSWVEQPKKYIKTVFTYMGRKKNSHQWTRIDAHGGVTTENIDQAISRDILRDGMMAQHKLGFYLVGHAHDETMAEERVGDNRYTLDLMLDTFKQALWWAPGLPLGAAGWVGNFYRK